MTDQFPFKNPNDFSLHIERMVLEYNISHMDAVLMYCEENMLEPEEIAPMVNKSLKEKIELNMQELNYLPKSATLDI